MPKRPRPHHHITRLQGKGYLERAGILHETWREVNPTPLRLEAFGYTEEEYRKTSPFIRSLIRDGCIEATA